MSKPHKSPSSSPSPPRKSPWRLFRSRRGTSQAGEKATRGRQSTRIYSVSPRRRVRLIFFSTWGSDYKQLDFSAKAFGSVLFCIFVAIGSLSVVATQTAGRLVQAYRLAAVTEDHQILRSRWSQADIRVRNLARRLHGLTEEESFRITQEGDKDELPALMTSSEEDSATWTESRRAGQAGSAKRGPLGLVWRENHSPIGESKDKEQNFYGQGGGAFVDDEDNIYPTENEKTRATLARAGFPGAVEGAAGGTAGSGSDLITQLEEHLSKTQELQKTIIAKFEIRRKQLEHIPSIKPLLSGRITDFFGKRVDPFVSRVRHHQGLDIGAPRGTEVFAPANGRVEFVKTTYRRNTGYGRAVVINHGYGVKTLYGHLSEIKVKAGQKIERWDILGLVGETGRATGPHLHYEVWVDGQARDPLRFILNN
jgi:murein DD-endopeptidase MepM/ murein hydrolase activator NlpD